MSGFVVAVRSYLSTLEDWGRVLSTPVDKLPELTPEQRANSKRWGTAEEDERRSLLYQDLQEERRRAYEAEGLALGRAVEAILENFDASGRFRLSAVIIDVARKRWVVRIVTPQRVLEWPLDSDLCEQVVRNGNREAQETLKHHVLGAVGREDLPAAG